MSNIKEGDIISIRHYAGVNPFKSVVMGITDNVITARLTKEFAVMNFFDGDPIVFGHLKNEEVSIVGCNILKIRPKEDIIEIKIDTVDEEAEKRRSERYPVSLYADIRTKDYKKKQLATIKDISYYGMLIYSKADFEINNELEVDIFMEKSVVFLKTNIVRKEASSNYNIFGLNIIYEDSSSLSYMKDYIKRLLQEQKESIRRLKIK